MEPAEGLLASAFQLNTPWALLSPSAPCRVLPQSRAESLPACEASSGRGVWAGLGHVGRHGHLG